MPRTIHSSTRHWRGLSAAVVGLSFLSQVPLVASAATATIEVMNPRGEIPPLAFHAPSNRVADLKGKKIGIYWIGKAGGDNFWDGVEASLRSRYPDATLVRYEGPFDLGDAQAAKLAKEVDTVLYGVGD